MAWTYLVVAGAFEIAWAVGLKYTEGFSRPWPSVGTALAMIASLYLLAEALKTIPVGTGYAVWTGIGIAGAAGLGMFLFSEPVSLLRLASFVLILCGIVGLRISA